MNKSAHSKNEKSEEVRIGFLTVLGTVPLGLIGGLLVLNRHGQPSEFHCTAPVRPNRAQEILYGRSLLPFLCGEQIAPALLRRAKSELFAVITDRSEVLSIDQNISPPILLLLPENGDISPPEGWLFNAWDAEQTNRIACPSLWRGQTSDDGAIIEKLSEFRRFIDWTEPFERIGLAIEESQKAG